MYTMCNMYTRLAADVSVHHREQSSGNLLSGILTQDWEQDGYLPEQHSVHNQTQSKPEDYVSDINLFFSTQQYRVERARGSVV